jgi:FkbM family methyltransferase
MPSRTIFDIGMYDGSDTRYFLVKGFKVLAVEANPALVQRAGIVFKQYIFSRQLTLVNAAISGEQGKEVTLTVCGDDLGSSSIYDQTITSRNPTGSYTVQGATILNLMDMYGVPYYLKIDIEGAERFCVLPLTTAQRPEYISFEAGDDLEELIQHAAGIGYKMFKLINQINFRELQNQRNIGDRLRKIALRGLGYAEPAYIRRKGRFFKTMHSSGPAPWISDGRWCSAGELIKKWRNAKGTNEFSGWYDVHAV